MLNTCWTRFKTFFRPSGGGAASASDMPTSNNSFDLLSNRYISSRNSIVSLHAESPLSFQYQEHIKLVGTKQSLPYGSSSPVMSSIFWDLNDATTTSSSGNSDRPKMGHSGLSCPRVLTGHYFKQNRRGIQSIEPSKNTLVFAMRPRRSQSLG